MAKDSGLSIRLVDGQYRFAGQAAGRPEVMIDAPAPLGGGDGYSPPEMLMMAFAACTAMAVASILRDRFGRTITDVTADAQGTAQERHPKKYTHIQLEVVLKSPDAEQAEVDKALATAEEVVCPVWAMIKGNVETGVVCRLERN